MGAGIGKFGNPGGTGIDLLGDTGGTLDVVKASRRRQIAEEERKAREQKEREERFFMLAANPNYDETHKDIANQRRDVEGREAPLAEAANVGALTDINAAQINRDNIGGQSDLRQRQIDYITQLEAQAKGQGPSLAQMQFQRANEQATKSLMGATAAQRGNRFAGAQIRNYMDATANAQQQAAAQSGMLRLEEQNRAQGMLNNALGQGLGYDTTYRGQNIGLETTQAQLEQQARLANQSAQNTGVLAEAGYQQQANLANQQSQLTTQQQMDARIAQLTAQGMTLDEARVQAQLEAAALGQQGRLGQAQLDAQGKITDRDWLGIGGGVASGVAGAAATALFSSDERKKKNISPGNKTIKDFLDNLEPKEYEYKNDKEVGASPGKHVGVMAQDLEKAGPIGEGMVEDTENGKMVDYGQGFSALLASQLFLHREIQKLETLLNKKDKK